LIDFNATLIAQIINFVILLALLTKLAWKPIMQMLEDRKTQIESDLANADKERQNAEQLRAEYQQQLAEARTQAQAIIEKAAKLAEQTKEQILEEARAENARLLKAAQEQIAIERERALAEMRSEVVALSVAAASKIIGQNLDANANAKLVADFIDKLDDKKIGGLKC
jgi:F-type H+-transporting ATPase subunit b